MAVIDERFDDVIHVWRPRNADAAVWTPIVDAMREGVIHSGTRHELNAETGKIGETSFRQPKFLCHPQAPLVVNALFMKFRRFFKTMQIVRAYCELFIDRRERDKETKNREKWSDAFRAQTLLPIVDYRRHFSLLI